ncbi:DUF460 domain-containing protein [Candidatus Woesearchaeota archaeon]|nr:DUF460 domain-containing protein [Candidatus Woesearchaeota archaeon]MBW3005188.1 DUF460 domain-containing protein [Candidatus Woesearchaeota archaeon]
MKEKHLLVVGIDPGTTTAYALLDVDGKVVGLHSAKELSVDNLISKVTAIGIPVCVGCDKAKIPAFVEKFAIQVSAKLFSPSEDIKIDEKRKLTKNLDFKNNHEMDALASAIFAYNRVEGLFRRVNKFLEGKKKTEFSNKVKELVVKKGMSISGALDLLTKPEKKEIKIVKKVVEQKKLAEKDFLELYNELKKAEKDNKILKQQNTLLSDKLKKAEKKPNKKQKITKTTPDERLKQKDKKIDFLNKEIDKKEKEISEKEKDINKFNDLLSGIKDKLVVKKLKNLGWSEFQAKQCNIHKGDVLLIEDPAEFSKKTLAELKDLVEIIIHKNDIPKKFLDLGFVFVNAEDLGKFQETELFAFVNKGRFEEARKSRDLLKKIIKAYKKARSI